MIWDQKRESLVNLWAYGLILVLYLVLAPYGNTLPERPTGSLVWTYVLTIMLVIVFEIVRAVFLRLSAGNYPLNLDERELQIASKGQRNALWSVLVVINLLLIYQLVNEGFMQVQGPEGYLLPPPLLSFHVLFGCLFLAQIVKAATKYISLRRGQ